MTQKEKPASQAAFLLTLVVLAASLRMPFTGVGTLLSAIQAELGLSETILGVLTSVPLLLFAVVSPLAAAAERRLGMGRTILAGLICIFAGVVIRSCTNTAGLFAGTALLACGIGVVNVLCLSLIKLRSTSKQAGAAISLYSTMMSVSATVSVSVSVPAADVLGWRGALVMWNVWILLAVVIWGVQFRRPENQMPAAAREERTSLKRLLRSPVAWQVTVFVGAQSLLFYCVTGWFPTILQSRGFTDAAAGVACSMLQIITIPFSLAAPFLCNKFRPAYVIAGSNALLTVGLLLFILAPNPAVHYAALFILGAGTGAIFSLSNLCYSLRTRNAADTAALSGMANCAGYLIAAVGPAVMGSLFDLTRSWMPSLLFLCAVLAVNIISSQLSARERYLFDS